MIDTKLTLTESFDHQKTLIEDTKDNRYFGYFLEQGTGKTHVTIAVMTHLFLSGKINGVIVFAPNGIQDNWAINEIPMHCMLKENEDMHTAVWHSNGSIRKKQRFRMDGATLPG